VVKYGVLADAEFFAWLESNGARALAGDSVALVRMVVQSCRTKADVVSRDERDTGERALLNLGHTFAHALESVTGYSGRLLHGEAVAAGMVLALKLSVQLGHASVADAERLERHLKSVSLPVGIRDIPGPRPDSDALLGHMRHDKKAQAGRLTFVLVRRIGEAFLANDVPLEVVRSLLKS
jgi:3-dehydroquinate synthase